MSTSKQICVVIPAYNESPAIGKVLAELCVYPYRVILVDDGSTDTTLDEARPFPVTILRHTINLGQGAALSTGIQYALRNLDIQAIVTFDADGQHDPANIARLVEALERGHDVALGSRFMEGGEAISIPWLKRLMLALAVRVTQQMTGLPLTDTHNGLRAFRRSAAASIQIQHNGMAHASEILSQVASLGLRYCEVPVSVRYTEYSLHKGQSVLNSFNILWEIIGGKMR
jgi:glycosyltransferase involved in cell wall biosynthesis